MYNLYRSIRVDWLKKDKIDEELNFKKFYNYISHVKFLIFSEIVKENIILKLK